MKFEDYFLTLCQWFAAAYTGLVAAAYCCILINGFVGFQFAEDGTPLSLWVRAVCQLDWLLQFSQSILAPTPIVSSNIRTWILHRHCDFQEDCWLRLHQTCSPVDRLHPLASNMRRHLHRVSARPSLPYARRPMAHRRYSLWRSLLCHCPGSPLCIQRYDL